MNLSSWTHIFCSESQKQAYLSLVRIWQQSKFVVRGDMSTVWSRPLVKALAERCSQAASCHAGLRCHALSSDWVTVRREKVTVSRQHGCHSHLPKLQRYKHWCGNYTHTHTLYNPSRKPEVIWNLCVCGLFVLGGVLHLCHVCSERSDCWVSNLILFSKLSKKCPQHPLSTINISGLSGLFFLSNSSMFMRGFSWNRHWSCHTSFLRTNNSP